ncbi:transketolase [bacterium]|nr:transketolase [bacterium]
MAPSSDQQLELLAKTLRILSAEAVEQANSGHPGMPMGAADYAALLWSDFLRFDPTAPGSASASEGGASSHDWLGRDRFVLSAGHGSALLYSLLHLFQYEVSLDDLKQFRQWESITPGHPEFGMTPGVETTTGPLGQGLANGVGLALSEKLLAERYSQELFGNRVFGIVSDGDLMEGVAAEAASLAGHLQLGNITYIYDDNEISIGGGTDVCFTENVAQRFESYGWHVQKCDGHDLPALRAALTAAVAESGRPSIICACTTIGYGSPTKADTSGVHGAPLGADELAATKKALGWEEEGSFSVPEAVTAFCQERVQAKQAERQEWESAFTKWKSNNPEKATQLSAQLAGEVPEALSEELLGTLSGIEKEATRGISGKAIQILAKHLPGFLGGSADLEPSNKTLIKESSDITATSFAGKNIRFGVREHAMGAMVNGLAYTKSWIPFTATFLVFADYMRPTIRLAALSHLQSLFVFTHDSFWVGEDGPTHEPIEHIHSLRIIPNLDVYRPADGMEVAIAYEMAIRTKNRPSALLFTRQNVPQIERGTSFSPDAIRQGAYVVSGEQVTDRVIVATGSEVAIAVEAAKNLTEAGTPFRVVSAPCLEQYFRLSAEDQAAIIPNGARVVSLEAGITTGWERVTGAAGLQIGIDHYGASAPGGTLAEKYGFTTSAVEQKIQDWIKS